MDRIYIVIACLTLVFCQIQTDRSSISEMILIEDNTIPASWQATEWAPDIDASANNFITTQSFLCGFEQFKRSSNEWWAFGLQRLKPIWCHRGKWHRQQITNYLGQDSASTTYVASYMCPVNKFIIAFQILSEYAGNDSNNSGINVIKFKCSGLGANRVPEGDWISTYDTPQTNDGNTFPTQATARDQVILEGFVTGIQTIDDGGQDDSVMIQGIRVYILRCQLSTNIYIMPTITIPDQTEVVIPVSTAAVTNSVAGTYNESTAQSSQYFVDILEDTDVCPQFCELLKDCDTSQVVNPINPEDIEIWMEQPDDVNPDFNTFTYYVNKDPSMTFDNQYCLKCWNQWQPTIFDFSDTFRVSVQCPDNGFQVYPPSSLLEVQYSPLSLDREHWPTFQFDSFHTNSEACQVQQYHISSNYSQFLAHVGLNENMTSSETFLENAVSGTVNSNTFTIGLVDGDSLQDIRFFLQITVVGGQIYLYTQELRLIATCPNSIEIYPSDPVTTIKQTLTLDISDNVYNWPDWISRMPSCSGIVNYEIIDATSTGVTNWYTYWAPSCLSNQAHCTSLQFDVSQIQEFTFRLRITTDDIAGSVYFSNTITIQIVNELADPAITWYDFSEHAKTIVLGSLDKFAFPSASCNRPHTIKYLFTTANTDLDFSTAVQVVPQITYTFNSGNFELSFDKSSLRTFSFYVFAYLEERTSVSSYYSFSDPAQFQGPIQVTIGCGNEVVSKNAALSDPLVLAPYERNSGTRTYYLTDQLFVSDIVLCLISEYKLFETASTSNPWTNSSVLLTNGITVSTAELQIATSDPFIISIFVQGLSIGGSYNFNEILITVCGREQISQTQAIIGTPFSAATLIGFPPIQVFQSEFSIFFEFTDLDHLDCAQSTYELLKQDCSSQLSSTPVSFVGGTISVATNNAFMDTEYCLKARTQGHKVASTMLTFAVCGFEAISLVDQNQLGKIDILASPADGDELHIIFDSYGYYFQSNSVLCPVSQYKLKILNSTSGQYMDYTGAEISLTGSTIYDLSLAVNTKNPFSGSVFIEGNSLTGQDPAYLEISLLICGFEQPESLDGTRQLMFMENSGVKYVKDNDYMEWFSNKTPINLNLLSSNYSESCPIHKYDVVADKNGSALNYTSLASMIISDHGSYAEHKEIRIQTILQDLDDEGLYEEEFYIEATTKGLKKAYKPVRVKIFGKHYQSDDINFAPYFTYSLRDEYVTINLLNKDVDGFNDEYKLYFPHIEDREGDKIYISQDSTMPWLTFYANETTSKLYGFIDKLMLDPSMNNQYIINIELSDDSGTSTPNTYEFRLDLFVISSDYSLTEFKTFKFELWDLMKACKPIIEIQFEIKCPEQSEDCDYLCIDICKNLLLKNLEVRQENFIIQPLYFRNYEFDMNLEIHQHPIIESIMLVVDPYNTRQYIRFSPYRSELTAKILEDALSKIIIYFETKNLIGEDGLKASNRDPENLPVAIGECQFSYGDEFWQKNIQNEGYQDLGMAVIYGDKTYFNTQYEIDPISFTKIDLNREWQPELEDIILTSHYVLEFQFNETLLQPSDFILEKIVNDTIFTIMIQSAIDGSYYFGRHDKYQEGIAVHDSNFAGQDLRFIWTLRKQIDDKLRIQLDFEKPQKISSTSYGQDLLIVQMENHPNLISKLSLKNIFNESLTQEVFYLNSNYPPESVVQLIENTVEISNNAMILISAGTFIVNIALAKSLQDLWGMLNSQQLIIHLAMMDVPIPGNALVVIAYLSELTQKDQYPTDDIYPLIFNFTETESAHPKFENLGYEGTNVIELSGSGLISIIVCIFSTIQLIILSYICTRFFKYAILRYIAIKLPQDNPIQMILRIFIETYLELLFSVLIGISVFNQSKQAIEDNFQGIDLAQGRRMLKVMSQQNSDKFSKVFAIVVLIILMLLPLSMIKIITHYFNRLDEPKIEEKFGFIYQDLGMKTQYQTFYHAVFLIRRGIYVINVVFLTSYPILQLIVHIVSTVIYIGYIAHHRPFKDRNHNNQEQFNEICILTASYCFFLFLNISLDGDQRNQIGWAFCVIIFIVLGVNSLKILYHILFRSLPSLYHYFIPPAHIQNYESWKAIQLERFQNHAKQWPNSELAQLNLKNFELSLEHCKEEKKLKKERAEIQKKIDWYYLKNVDHQDTLELLLKERDELIKPLKLLRRLQKEQFQKQRKLSNKKDEEGGGKVLEVYHNFKVREIEQKKKGQRSKRESKSKTEQKIKRESERSQKKNKNKKLPDRDLMLVEDQFQVDTDSNDSRNLQNGINSKPKKSIDEFMRKKELMKTQSISKHETNQDAKPASNGEYKYTNERKEDKVRKPKKANYGNKKALAAKVKSKQLKIYN